MRDTIEIKRDDYEETSSRITEKRPLKNDNKERSSKKTEKRKSKRSNTQKAGIIISLIFILAGLIWYGVNIGIIPTQFVIQQAGPILIVILGLLILIKSL
ncbi:MAG: hypothetical protein ACXVHP_01630 [Methanobacterium sp.]